MTSPMMTARKVLRQKTRTTLPTEKLSEQVLQWLAPYISDGSVVSLPRSLYLPLILGPSREFVRIWLRTRQPAEIQAARDPLAKAAWLVIAAPVSQMSMLNAATQRHPVLFCLLPH